MLTNIAFICYSHSSYSDLWDMFFGQVSKFLPGVKKYLFVDSLPKHVDDDITVITYDDSECYATRVKNCLSKVSEDLCFYNHEDFIIYDTPKVDKLNELIELVSSKNIDYVKLLRGDCHNGYDNIALKHIPIDNLYYIPHTGLSFTIQPSIFRVSDLSEIMINCSDSGVHQIEESGSSYVNNSNLHGLFWYAGENKRGSHHWDSSVYPHGGMISKGKWCASIYKNELDELSCRYGIDLNKRGVV
tara:strand:- start:1045 stop:1776 length:732 start_codon:yes stop_codon:yes gene_type:complete